MRFLVIFISIFLFASNIDKKIKTTKSTLNKTKTQISNMNNKLDSIVKKINKEYSYLYKIKKQINNLNSKIDELKKSLNNKNNYLKQLSNKKVSLLQKKANLEKEVIDFISNNYYVQNNNVSSQNDLINSEILKVVTKESAKKMDKIASYYAQIDTSIKKISNTIDEIKNAKQNLQKRKQELAKLIKKQNQNIKQLQAIKLKYKKALQKIIYEQNKLQNQLAKLNVIKVQEVKKQRQYAKQNFKKVEKVKVRNYGNIYMKTKTTRYRGVKTIAPVNGVIVKRFGAYKDPVYNIELYNDSITIQTKPNTKVRAIFNGRVVYVDKNSKMIVIKHGNQLYSIYAKLSRISPFIKKGYRVKKGDIIAKVDKELEFETTYKTLPINPLQVIKF